MNPEKEMLIVGEAIVRSVRLRLGEDWFAIESEFIRLFGLNLGLEKADDILWKITLGLSEGRTIHELACVLQGPFWLKGVRLPDAEKTILTIQQKCASEIAAWKDAVDWMCYNGMNAHDIILELYENLLRIYPTILNFGEDPELRWGSLLCLESAVNRVDYKALKGKALEAHGEENEQWFREIVLSILTAMSNLKNRGKICSAIRDGFQLGPKTPDWLKELVGQIGKNCRKEAGALLALKCAVLSHCKPERIREIVQERLGK